jgi:hypothetical protein
MYPVATNGQTAYRLYFMMHCAVRPLPEDLVSRSKPLRQAKTRLRTGPGAPGNINSEAYAGSKSESKSCTLNSGHRIEASFKEALTTTQSGDGKDIIKYRSSYPTIIQSDKFIRKTRYFPERPKAKLTGILFNPPHQVSCGVIFVRREYNNDSRNGFGAAGNAAPSGGECASTGDHDRTLRAWRAAYRT